MAPATPDELRQFAADARQFAQSITDPVVRARIERLAADLERLAERRQSGDGQKDG